jgi:8-oxo-dGTP pyrophosphatase MutT (NUDIX family)
MSRNAAPNLQYAALPYRRRADGVVEVMLVTSRDTGRWVIPKGWPVPGLGPQDSAAREAMEEAGLVGRISERSIGSYHYEKQFADGSAARCAVATFALEVERQSRSWPEQSQRQTRWFALPEAAEAVQEPELSALILKLAAILAE